MYVGETSNKRPAIRTSVSMTPVEMLYERARTSPNGIAFVAGHDQWNYARLAARVERLARDLAEHGIRKSDRIALHISTRPELVIAIYASFHAGAVAVPLNHRLNAAELKLILELVRPALYIGDAEVYREMDAIDCSILPYEKRFVTGDTRRNNDALPWEKLFSSMSGPLPVVTDIHSPAVLMATTGTSRVPNFITHTHAALAAVFGLPFMCDAA
jgi:long-chain acyl-CoA synthetase